MGKDFSKDTVELTGLTDPGAYIAFSAMDYQMYANQGYDDNFLNENKVRNRFS